MTQFPVVPVRAGAVIVAMAAVIGLAPGLAQACDPQAALGAVCFTAADSCPRGMVSAVGQVYQQQANPPLYVLLGSAFGGDETSFQLPNLQGRTPIGENPGGIGLETVLRGEARGSYTQSLAMDQLPQHNHYATFAVGPSPQPTGSVTASAGTGTGTGPSATTNTIAGTTMPMWVANADNPVQIAGVSATISGDFIAGSVTNRPTGSSQSFYILPPSIGLTTCIVVEGPYPPAPN